MRRSEFINCRLCFSTWERGVRLPRFSKIKHSKLLWPLTWEHS